VIFGALLLLLFGYAASGVAEKVVPHRKQQTAL
jgi:hypothetical protein